MDQPQQYNEEIDLREYYKLIYKNRRLVALFLILGLIFGYIANILPIYNYRAKAAIRVATVSGAPIEPLSQTAEKLRNSFYGKNLSLSADYVSSAGLVQIWADDKSEELAKKSISDIVDKIIKEQNDLIKKQKENMEDKIKRLKNIITTRRQEVALLQIEIMRIEDQINSIRQAELLNGVSVAHRKISLQMSLILGLLFGLVASIIYIFAKDWWMNARALTLNSRTA